WNWTANLQMGVANLQDKYQQAITFYKKLLSALKNPNPNGDRFQKAIRHALDNAKDAMGNSKYKNVTTVSIPDPEKIDVSSVDPSLQFNPTLSGDFDNNVGIREMDAIRGYNSWGEWGNPDRT